MVLPFRAIWKVLPRMVHVTDVEDVSLNLQVPVYTVVVPHAPARLPENVTVVPVWTTATFPSRQQQLVLEQPALTKYDPVQLEEVGEEIGAEVGEEVGEEVGKKLARSNRKCSRRRKTFLSKVNSGCARRCTWARWSGLAY